MQLHVCKRFDLLLYSFPECVHLHISPWTHRGIHLSVVHCAPKQVRAAADIDQTDF